MKAVSSSIKAGTHFYYWNSSYSSSDLQYLQQITKLIFVKFQVKFNLNFILNTFLQLKTTQIITMVNG